MAKPETHSAPLAGWRRRLAATAAAIVGIAGGALFGEPALALVGRVWSGFLLPAYLEIQKSGLPFCG